MKQLRRILLISGGRYNFNYQLIVTNLQRWEPHLIIHGGAIGTDTIAADWADKNGVAATRIPVPPGDYTLFGNKAPLMRNTTMVHHVLDQYCWNDNGVWRQRPTYKVCGMFFPGKNGTADCKGKWLETGLDAEEISLSSWTAYGHIPER